MPVKPVKSWSSTLRLPRSSFPYRPSQSDQAKYLRRCSDDLYEWQSRERSGQKPFVLHDGPPFANGSLHVGHALNKILKDMICRVKLQQGHRVVYVPGWDCHGLPIEIKALAKQREKSQSEDFDPISIRRAARSLAQKTVKEQMKGFREWGVMADWGKAWQTMDKSFEIKQLGVFQDMVKRGVISRRYKPVYWSPSSRSALAEAELEYKEDHESTAAYIKFPISALPDALSSLGLDGTKLLAVIWTTTPWTLPANRAIAIHADLQYTVVKFASEHLIVAKTRVEQLRNALCMQDPPKVIVECFFGRDLEGARYINPLRGRDAEAQSIIHADFVSADSGTGLVHCAPGHGMDDYEVGTRLGIEAAAPVDDLGCFTSDAFPDDPSRLEGKSVLLDGNSAVLDILGDMVLARHKYKHKYPYDWRTKLPIIVRATEQWFADVGSIKRDALRHLNDVTFIPRSGKSRLESFVQGRSEWCISRQRAWGVPIPALYDENGGAVLTDASVAHIISVINERGIDAWWTDASDDRAWLVEGLEGTYRRGADTMDVWFDSGSSWSQTGEQADVYSEGTDQHRGWFQSSLLTHTSASGNDFAPFKTLITHGFTLDQNGRKMSKSIGNVIAPSQIMDGSLIPEPAMKKKMGFASQAFGPDALRLWVASSDYTNDITISQPVLRSNHSTLLKYRITVKMLLGSMHAAARTAPLSKLDQIAIVQLESVMAEVFAAYNSFEFYRGVNAINRWISNDLSAFYLEAMKDRLYTGDGGGVLEHMFNGLLRMLTPITPSLVEEAWEHRPEWMQIEYQVHPFHQKINGPLSARAVDVESHVAADLHWLLKANTAIKAAQEQARGSKVMGSSLECSVVLQIPPEASVVFERYSNELDNIFIVSSVRIGGDLHGEWQYAANFDTPGGTGTAWVLPPTNAKCSRCWRYVASSKDKLCGRCEGIVRAS